MGEPGFLFNPAGSALWGAHAVLNGRSRRHDVDRFVGPVSIKTVRRGSATWETARGQFTITPETYLVLSEGEEYSMRIRSTEPVETFCVFMREGTLDRGLTARIDMLEGPIAESLDCIRRIASSGAIEGMEADEAVLDLAGTLDEADQRASGAAGRLARRPAAGQELREALDRSREHILLRADERMSIEDLAAKASISTFHFHRLYRQAYGESPHATLTRIRIARAKRLLREGMEVGAVTFECGFESVPTFCRLFKSRVGASPARFSRIG